MFKCALVTLALCLSAFGQTDGPATLPQRTPLTTIVAKNATKTVGSSTGLRTVLNTAVCGDVISVDPTSVTSGTVTVSANCDPSNGIIITSSAPVQVDAKGRVVPGQQLPKIILHGSETVNTGSGVWWIGFEIQNLAGGGTTYNLIAPAAGSHDIILDRMYVHGSSDDETVRGLFLTSNKNVTVINNYFSDFHCKALGTCGDAQAIAAGIADAADSGNYLIKNNFLQGAGENIILGGGGDNYSPTDVRVQNNDFSKPDTWNPGSPLYKGKPWIVKNLLEFKNCVRCLVEGNRMVGTWGGYTQIGFAILVGAKNQNGSCANCTVDDIVIRNNWISHTGQSMQIMFAPSGSGDLAKEETRVSIHDNVFDDQQYQDCYQCGQWLVQLSSVSSALSKISIVQNTFLVSQWKRDGGFLVIGGPAGGGLVGLHVDNNIASAGKYPIYSTGGGASNCAVAGSLNFATMISGCWDSTSSFAGNTMLANGTTSKYTWPAGNNVVTNGANVLTLQTALKGVQ